MAKISRRRLLATGATASAASLAGCFSSNTSATIVGSSDCFESVTVDSDIGTFWSEVLTASLSENCATEFIVAVKDGDQADFDGLGTGESKGTVRIDGDGYYELLAVVGGTVSDSEHTGGEVLERVNVEVSG